MPLARTFRRAALPAIALSAALALTACGGSGAATESEDTAGPLEKYLTALYETGGQSAAEAAKEATEVEELVAACMTAEGFEYTPVPQTEEDFSYLDEPIGGTEDELSSGTIEFAEQYGYGIVTYPGFEESTEEFEVSAEEADEWVDPNSDYLESLSESEQTAYYAVLYGDDPTDEQMADEDYSPTWEDMGCYGAAQHETGADGTDDVVMQAYEDPEFTDLFAAMESLYTTEDETGTNELDAEWAECMADAGITDYTSPNEAEMGLYAEYDALSMPDGEDGEWAEPSAADQETFQHREIEVAVADATCRDSIDYADRLLEQSHAEEQEFVDEHRTELDALLAKYATQGE